MRRRRTFLILFVILLVVLAIGVVALVFLQGGLGGGPEPPPTGVPGIPEATVTPEIETERVVVALQAIPRGMRIPPDAVEVREWPVEDRDFPEDPVYDLDDVVGMVARVEIPMHRPVSDSMVKQVFLGEGSEMSLAIPKGKVAFAVPLMAMSAVANAVRPNDRVDVLISFSFVEVDEDSQIKRPVVLVGGEDCLAGCQPTGEQIARLVTQYTVQNALVMGVGLWTEERPDIQVVQPVASEGTESTAPQIPLAQGGASEEQAPAPVSIVQSLTQLTVVTLAVDPFDALVLKWAMESNAAVSLAMRSAGDNDSFGQPEAVTLQYMIDRFQIAMPPKLPLTPENLFEYRLIKEAEAREVPPQE